MTEPSLIEAIEFAAKRRGEPTIPRDFVTEALERIKGGQETTSEEDMYPSGQPTARFVWKVAQRLYAKSASST